MLCDKERKLVNAYDLILFDRDGTLSDPLQGIGRCFNYALSYYGYETREIAQFGHCVGPPLDTTFESLIGPMHKDGTVHKDEIPALVAKYRERYSEIGFSENVLYPGVAEALRSLSQAGMPMGVCTSKRKDFAERILQMFGLLDLFQFVDGGDIGIHKWQQIAHLRAQGLATEASLMVGDRAVDIIAAHQNGLRGGGVLWGYGGLDELARERPHYLFRSPAEWLLLEQPERYS